MGIFYFLFGNKKEKTQKVQHSEKHNPTSPPVKSKTDKTLLFRYNKESKEWMEELEKIITLNSESERAYYTLSNQLHNIQPIKKFLAYAYLVGAGHITIEKAQNSGFNFQSINIHDTITKLYGAFQNYNQLSSVHLKDALKGSIELFIKHEEVEQELKDKPGYYFNSHFSYPFNLFARNNEDYYLSFLLETFKKSTLKKKLYYLLQSINSLSDQSYNNLEDEIIPFLSQESAPSVLNGKELFQSPEEIKAYIQYKRKVSTLGRNNTETTNIELVKEALEGFENPAFFLQLLAYDTQLSLYNKHNNEAFKYIVKNVEVDYGLMHGLLDQLITKPGHHIDSKATTQIFNIVKKYFADEPLDVESYQKLLIFMSKVKSISKARSINKLLLAKANQLYNLPHDSVIHKYLHSGVLFFRHESSGRENSKYYTDILKLISQSIPAIMIEEAKKYGSHKIKVGNEEIEVRGKILDTINQSLYRQSIPYQIVHNKLTPQNKNISNEVFSTLILNEEEYHSLSHQLMRNFNENDKKRYFNNINFAKADDNVDNLVNNIAKVKKEINDEISDNRFLHDIKWKDIKRNIVDHFPEKRLWYEFMHQVVSYSGSVAPSAKWKKETKLLADKFTEEVFEDGIKQLVFDVLLNDFWFNKENLKALRGMIWSTTLLPNTQAASYLEKLLKVSYEKVRHVGPKSVSGGSSCLSALIDLDSKESYGTLVRLKEETKYKRLENLLIDALNKFEKKSANKVAALKESATEDFNFLNGSKIDEIEHPYFVRWQIKDRSAVSQWIDNTGNILKKSPSLKNKNAKKEITAITKSINAAISSFDYRMKTYRFGDISWKADDWLENYFNHQFVSLIIDNYLWMITSPTIEQVVISQKGKLLDIEGNTVTLQETDVVRPYHQFLVSPETNESWKNYFIKNRITPHIELFYRFHGPKEEVESTLERYLQLTEHPSLFGYINVREFDGRAYAKELIFINKLMLVSQKRGKENNYRITFHELPPKKSSKYNYSAKDIGPEIDKSEIPNTVYYECLNDVIISLRKNYIANRRNEVDIETIKSLPYYQFIEDIFKIVETKKIFKNLTYKDYILHLQGNVHTYEIPVYWWGLALIPKRKRRRAKQLYAMSKLKRDYAQLINMPLVISDHLKNLFYILELLSNDDKIKDKWINEWVNDNEDDYLEI